MRLKVRKLLPLLLSGCLLLTACGGDRPAAPEEPSSSVPETEAPVVDWLDKSYTYHRELNGDLNFRYRIPQLTDPGAEALNEEILRTLEPLVEECIRVAEIEEVPDYSSCLWEAFENGPVLSLKVELLNGWEESTGFVWNFDRETGTVLSAGDLIRRDGRTGEEILQCARDAAAAEYDDLIASLISGEGVSWPADIYEMRQATISPETMGEELRLYLDGEGRLSALLHTATPAGAGWYEASLALPDHRNSPRNKSVSKYGITAQLTDNRIAVTFAADLPDLEWLEERGLRPNVPYEVRGLYGTCTDLDLFHMGNGGSIVLFLIDEGGRVSFCDLTESVFNGGPEALILTGPLGGPVDIRSFVQREGLLYGVSGDGTEFGLDDPVLRLKEETVSLVSEGGYLSDEGWSLDVSRDRLSLSSYGLGYETEGWCSFCGISEEGLVYQFHTQDGLSGLLIRPVWEYTYRLDDPIPPVILRLCPGCSLPDGSGLTELLLYPGVG